MPKRSPPVLPPRQKLDLPRPDLSAKEALVIVDSLLRLASLHAVPVGMRLAGAASLDGRLALGVGAWQFLFCVNESTLFDTWIYFNGNFSADYVQRLFPEPVPPRIEEPWIDSTQAADAVARTPIVPGVVGKDTLYLNFAEGRQRRFWEVSRSAYNVEAKMQRRHEFLVDAQTAAVTFEKFTLTRGASVVETWEHLHEG